MVIGLFIYCLIFYSFDLLFVLLTLIFYWLRELVLKIIIVFLYFILIVVVVGRVYYIFDWLARAIVFGWFLFIWSSNIFGGLLGWRIYRNFIPLGWKLLLYFWDFGWVWILVIGVKIEVGFKLGFGLKLCLTWLWIARSFANFKDHSSIVDVGGFKPSYAFDFEKIVFTVFVEKNLVCYVVKMICTICMVVIFLLGYFDDSNILVLMLWLCWVVSFPLVISIRMDCLSPFLACVIVVSTVFYGFPMFGITEE